MEAIITLEIEKNVYGGYGIGYHNEKVVFVTNAIKGDRVEAIITLSKKNHSFAKIKKIITKSEIRETPSCENFDNCGGCSYLNMNYEEELLIKKNIIIDQLTRIGKLKIEEIPEIETISENRLNYRSHASIKFKDGKAGFYRRETNYFIPFTDSGCSLLHPDLNKLLMSNKLIHINMEINKWLNKTFSIKNPLNWNCPSCDTGILIVDSEKDNNVKIAMTSENNVISILSKNKIVSEKINGITYQRNILNFFQSNRYLRKKMLDKVVEIIKKDDQKTFIDIGSGVGFFTLQLSKYFKKGLGFEIDNESVSWAKKNALANNIKNIKFSAKPSSQIHPTREKSDILIADPPRAGLDKKTRKTIGAISPEQIIYVSCNPSTYSRDIADFIKIGYKLKNLTFIDMFPGTHHIELISSLEKY